MQQTHATDAASVGIAGIAEVKQGVGRLSPSSSRTTATTLANCWTCLVLMTLVLMTLVLMSALHPISSDDFWWQLSRGRVVMKGDMASGQGLQAGDASSEADWLGGVPFFRLDNVAGQNGLMLWKVVVVWGLAAWTWRISRHLGRATRWIATFGVTLVAGQLSEPTSPNGTCSGSGFAVLTEAASADVHCRASPVSGVPRVSLGQPCSGLSVYSVSVGCNLPAADAE